MLENFPKRALAGLLRVLLFPFSLPHRPPSDALGSAVAQAMQTAGADRERLLADCYLANDASDPVACGEMALALLHQVESIEKRLIDAPQSGVLQRTPQNVPAIEEWLAAAAAAGLLSSQEGASLSEFARLTDAMVQVDDFSPEYATAAACTC